MEGAVGEERLDYAVLIALAGREEAEVVASALRADGIDAFIGNSNHAYVEWLLVPAFNGLQIMVPRQKLAEAKNLLRERIKDFAADDDGAEPAIRRDRWRSWIGAGLMLWPTPVSILTYGELGWSLFGLGSG
jgi:hypothetical protein